MPEEKIINLGEGINVSQPTSEPKVANLGGEVNFPNISLDVPSVGSKTGVAGSNMSPQDIWNNTDPGKTHVPQLPLSSIYIGNRYKSSRPYETDLEEKYAQQQSALDQWKNGALKFVGTATNSFISGTAGTVYGLGACATNRQAVERVYKVKERPRNMALPLLLANTSQISEVAYPIPQVTWLLVHNFLHEF